MDKEIRIKKKKKVKIIFYLRAEPANNSKDVVKQV